MTSGISINELRDDACEEAGRWQPPLPSIPTTHIRVQVLITSHLKPLHKPSAVLSASSLASTVLPNSLSSK